ncbi:MAG: N-acetylmuramoyl-L-alanine amidase [Alphaproteobacteria bacterium]|nr:N-acetylmuramoyl-L-alanine amidase [Alphaproteobacteria bacterium]
MFFKRWVSPNFNDRAGGQKPSLIILHYTDMPDARAALERLCDTEAQVSAHYVIEENGKIHTLVPEDKRAWHAGVSVWQGQDDINSRSVGIELVNPGHSNGYRPFPKKQIKKLIALCQSIQQRWAIPAAGVLGHSDVAPTRKEDPGHLFPWQELAGHGLGLWPAPQEMDYHAAEDIILHPQTLHELLAAYGYDAAADVRDVIIAFHRHYAPEKFAPGQDPAAPDIATVARLLALIRQSHERTR